MSGGGLNPDQDPDGQTDVDHVNGGGPRLGVMSLKCRVAFQAGQNDGRHGGGISIHVKLNILIGLFFFLRYMNDMSC